MSNPWDPLPFPTRGDSNADTTHLHVGRLISTWESIEFALCRIQSFFVGDPEGEAMRLYGTKRSFPGRLDDFGKIAAAFFISNSDQAKEIELHQLLGAMAGFVKRRNEVAHGIVVRIDNVGFFRANLNKPDRTPQFAVCPPYHMSWGHGEDGLPLYAYPSMQLDTLTKRMLPLFISLADYPKGLKITQPLPIPPPPSVGR